MASSQHHEVIVEQFDLTHALSSTPHGLEGQDGDDDLFGDELSPEEAKVLEDMARDGGNGEAQHLNYENQYDNGEEHVNDCGDDLSKNNQDKNRNVNCGELHNLQSNGYGNEFGNNNQQNGEEEHGDLSHDGELNGFHGGDGDMNAFDEYAINEFQQSGESSNRDAPHGVLSSERHNDQLDSNSDAVALLEALVNYEFPSSGNDPPITNHHFDSLLQAAATARGQVNKSVRSSSNLTQNSHNQASPSKVAPFPYNGSAKRKRPNDKEGLTKSTEKEDAEALIDAKQRVIWGPEHGHNESNPLTQAQQLSVPFGSVEVGAGLLGAAAIFRKPTKASKKGSRPQMARVWASLELSPEDFVTLNAGAKDYMLDPNHKDRREAVGIRADKEPLSASDMAMVRLKLFECVRKFVEDQGWGERFWGINATNSVRRVLFWPRTSREIITRITPLLRRVVTNERQRIYALETRREARLSSAASPTDQSKTKKPRISSQAQSVEDYETQNPYDPNTTLIDPSLNSYHYTLNSSLPTKAISSTPVTNPPSISSESTIAALTEKHSSESTPPTHHSPTEDDTILEMKYHVSFLLSEGTIGGKLIAPKIVLSPHLCPSYDRLMELASAAIAEMPFTISTVKIHSAEAGLVVVNSNEKMKEVITDIERCFWMEGLVRILVLLKSTETKTPEIVEK